MLHPHSQTPREYTSCFCPPSLDSAGQTPGTLPFLPEFPLPFTLCSYPHPLGPVAGCSEIEPPLGGAWLLPGEQGLELRA